MGRGGLNTDIMKKAASRVFLALGLGASFLLLYGIFLDSASRPLTLLIWFFLSGAGLILSAKTRGVGMRVALWWLYFEYLLILFFFTLFDPFYGRSFTSIFTVTPARRAEYLEMNMNLIPFETILLFLRGFMEGRVLLSSLIRNIFGNLLAFSPFGFFLGVLKPKMGHGGFLLRVFLCVFTVESLQLILMAGSFDTDDFILNLLGAWLVFWAFRSAGGRKVAERLVG